MGYFVGESMRTRGNSCCLFLSGMERRVQGKGGTVNDVMEPLSCVQGVANVLCSPAAIVSVKGGTVSSATDNP